MNFPVLPNLARSYAVCQVLGSIPTEHSVWSANAIVDPCGRGGRGRWKLHRYQQASSPGGGGILYPEVSEILSPVVSVFTIDNSVDSLARARAARVMVGLSVAAVRVVRVRRETNHPRLDTNLAKNFQEPFSDR